MIPYELSEMMELLRKHEPELFSEWEDAQITELDALVSQIIGREVAGYEGVAETCMEASKVLREKYEK